jgi:hypothetical protein
MLLMFSIKSMRIATSRVGRISHRRVWMSGTYFGFYHLIISSNPTLNHHFTPLK